METVLVGLDTSDAGADALRWAAEYCRFSGEELVGAVAYRPTQSEFPPDWYDEEFADVRKEAEARLDDVAPDVPHRLVARDGDPHGVFAEIAGEEHAAMVVLGPGGNAGFRGLGLGSVAHHLSRHLLVPVVVVPALGRPLHARPVVVGLDGAAGDMVTLDWAVQLAQTVDGTVCVVYASDPMAMSYPHPRGGTVADQLEMVVRDHVAAVDAAGVGVTFSVEVADPVNALAQVAARREASTIVVGRKGAGHLHGVFLGRVPAQLPFHAGRPVAVIPRESSE
jgi:nucleotide-binding universal stress UspA family protein